MDYYGYEKFPVVGSGKEKRYLKKKVVEKLLEFYS